MTSTARSGPEPSPSGRGRRQDRALARAQDPRYDHHGHLTPSGPLSEHPRALLTMVAALVVLAFVAHRHGGSALDTWDEPIQRWMQDRRTPALDTFFRSVSRLGSNIVIFPVAVVLAAVAWFRCRPLSAAIVGAVALRPLFEFVIKDLVGRPRPDLGRLVTGTGFSHPSGHVLATVTLCSLFPAVIALYLGRRRLWWTTWAGVGLLGPLMAVTRVYLGVHWATDVVAGMLWAAAYLALVEWIFARYHVGRCGHRSANWRKHEEPPHRLDFDHPQVGTEAVPGSGPVSPARHESRR